MEARKLPLGGSTQRSEETSATEMQQSNGARGTSAHEGENPSPPDSSHQVDSAGTSQQSGWGLPLSRLSQDSEENNPEDSTMEISTPNIKPTIDDSVPAKAEEDRSESNHITSDSIDDNGDLAEPPTRKRALPDQVSLELFALEEDGKESTVKIILDGKIYVPCPGRITDSSENEFLGHDGNQFYCEICGEFGNVVCCDGCPRVYHQECIPKDNPSRKSLDNDDDPWFCPKCINKKHSAEPGRRRDKPRRRESDRNSRQHRCVDCQEVDTSLEPCEECGNYVHHPSCSGESFGTERVFCSTCRAVDELTHEEDVLHETQPPEEQQADDEANEQDGRGRPKRRRSGSMDFSQRSGDDRRRKKKRKKKQNLSPSVEIDDRDLLSFATGGPSLVHHGNSTAAQAKPAFYFFLTENRFKIERVLARKHRYFNRLPKGSERNALVAKEAALWWVKLRPTDHRRYMNMSMRDYESRIIEWKGEKNLRDMVRDSEDEGDFLEESKVDLSAGDDRLTYERHERLYLGTSVGSKPFKAEPGQSYNRVLLDLLHDMRFHPIPMFAAERMDRDTLPEEYNSRVTIPYFDVHGPISTSVGDECLGCTRGWTHYCPVLQRRMPAVEHRAKLQPPLSSLMATRVGLGLRPRLERAVAQDGSGKKAELFETRDSEEFKELCNLPVLPSSSLPDPSERSDDIVQFIEESIFMKVPEPPRPDRIDGSQTTSRKTHSLNRILPTQKHRYGNDSSESTRSSVAMKCGRCRTMVQNDTGCVECRRAQLVINTSKRQPSSSIRPTKVDSKILKVHTAMLGRIQTKEGSEDTQSAGDQAVSNAILRERWMPCTIQAPQTALAPTPSRRPKEEGLKGDSDDSTSDKDAPMETFGSDEGVDYLAPELQPEDELSGEDYSYEKRPQRSARLIAASALMDVGEPVDRQKLLEEHKKEAKALHKKTLSIACSGILLALMRRDPLLLFAQPVTAEGYSAIIKNPIDLGKMRANVLADSYSSLGSFVSDARLLCENALIYNPPGSIYAKTAEELRDVLAIMQERASDWMGAIKDAHASFLSREKPTGKKASPRADAGDGWSERSGEPFAELREKWPEAVDMLENGEWLRRQVEADFIRTKENETSYYGSLAVRRVAAAAEASLAPYTDSGGMHSVVSKRNHRDDDALRRHVDQRISGIVDPVQLKDISTLREESVIRLLRKVQSRRLERRIVSKNGCARCDALLVDNERKQAMSADSVHLGKTKKKDEDEISRAHASRMDLTTGLGSAKNREQTEQWQKLSQDAAYDATDQVFVSVRGSKIHGWGLFADQRFRKGDVVAEYKGEYVSYPLADSREKSYQDHRIQDYQFRLDEKLVIDATMKGGSARYINHNCTPNCFAKTISGKSQNEHLKRVVIIAQRDIEINEEITYDYQFPLELDLKARIPCNCQSDQCRGFMNWDLPEKGSNNRALIVNKRGANMRDRIRRLGRPLKRDEEA